MNIKSALSLPDFVDLLQALEYDWLLDSCSHPCTLCDMQWFRLVYIVMCTHTVRGQGLSFSFSLSYL